MAGTTKFWLIVAFLLLVLGILLFSLILMTNGFDIFRDKGETNTQEVTDDFTNISLSTSTADILFLPSEDGKTKVVCHENPKAKHSAKVNDGTLTINEVDERKWYDHVGFNVYKTKITVYLPEAEYGSLLITASTGDINVAKDFMFNSANINLSTGDVKFLASTKNDLSIKTSTGDIKLEGGAFASATLSVSTGDIVLEGVACTDDISISVSTGNSYLTDVTAKNLTSAGSTGDMKLGNVIIGEKISIKRSTGDILFSDCDGGEIHMETNTGDVTGTLISQKVFITKTSTGKIDVPEEMSGGKCKITTSTGNIKISYSAGAASTQ